MTETWYGGPGIDTAHERDLFRYRPDLKYIHNPGSFISQQDVVNQMERARDFKISDTILEYEKVKEDVESLKELILSRNQTNDFISYLEGLKNGDKDAYLAIEEERSRIDGTIDYELYTILHKMGQSLEVRGSYLGEKFVSQISDETQLEDIYEDEWSSLNKWVHIENQVQNWFKDMPHDEEESEERQKQFQLLEDQRRALELQHETIGDVAYVHKVRTMTYSDIVDRVRPLVENSKSLLEGDMKGFLQKTQKIAKLGQPSLLLGFKKDRESHYKMKNQYSIIDDEKETFASDRYHLNQTLKIHQTDGVRNWLYEQEEDEDHLLDDFAEMLVDSIDTSEKDYNDSLADLLHFYQQEGQFYKKQLQFIIDKEKKRRFYRIFKDLEGMDTISDEWIAQYLEDEGYVD